MATETSATGSKPTQVPILNLTQDLTTSTVNIIANERISPPLSPTSASLKSNQQANDQQLVQKYIEARQLPDPEQARILFAELIRDTPKTEAHLLFLADCKLCLAYTHPEESEERTQAALFAKVNLDRAYENRSAWDFLGEGDKIERYKHLRTCLKNFEHLVEDDVASLDNCVKSHIEECNRHIPLITDFYDKLIEGDRLEGDDARVVYQQALQMIKDREEPGYLLARAVGTTNLALTHRTDDNNPFSLAAFDQTLLAYQQKDALFTSNPAKLNALNFFNKLFHNLIQLLPDDSEQLIVINAMRKECKEELARCQDSIPEDENCPKVTKEPVNHWKTARLVIAFGFAIAIIGGAFVLGRRYITRLN